MTRRIASVVPLLIAAAVVAGCAAGRAYKRGQEASLRGDWELAVVHYTKAVQGSPGRADYKIYLERAMIEAARLRLERARTLEAKGDLETAIVEYRRVLELNPANREALTRASELEKTVRDRLEASRPKPPIEQMRQQARRETQAPLLNPTSRDPLVLKFNNASTQDILNFVGNATGINVTFERDFRPAPFSIQLEGVTLEEALNQIMSANQLWYKVINERTILVIPDNNQKRQLYEDQVIRTFYLSHSDPQEVAQLINQITRVPGVAIQPTIAPNKTANTITVRATRGMAEIIEKVIEANDRPRAEIIVDVEILEVNRTKSKQYGLNLGSYSIGAIFSPESKPGSSDSTTGSSSGTTTSPFNLNTITQGISTADFYMTVPQAVVRFLATDSQTRQIAKPQLRGMEGQKLTLNLGDEIPVPSTVFTPLASGGTAVNPLTSFSYRNVGVNVEMTPRVSYEGDILLDISIESSNLGDNVTVAGQSLPSFGSRKVTTRLRLREGESNLLAGLIREQDRKTLRGLPGIMNLPVLRQLMSDNDTSESQTDIVMLLTPRIVRTHQLTQQDLSPINIGTQQNIGLSSSPQLFGAPPPEPPAAPQPVPPPAASAPAVPSPVAQPGAQVPPVAAPTGAQTAGQPPAGVRLPEGTEPRPVTPPGTSPIPGTTMAPPTAPQTPAQPIAPPPAATPAPAEPAPQPPAPTPTPAPAGQTPPPSTPPGPPVTPTQIVITAPSNEFRLGGGPYTVPLSMLGASRASTVTISLSFNPAVLRVRAVQEGSFLRQGGVQVVFTQQVDAQAGRVDVSMTRTGDQTGASGAGLLAAIVFEPIAAGTATLAANATVLDPRGAPSSVTIAPTAVTVR